MIWGVEPRAGKDQECAWGAGSCPGGCTARWGLWWAAALGATQHEVGVALEMGPVPNRGTWPLRGSMCGGTGPPAVTGPARAADGAVAGQAAGWWLGAALDPSGDLSSLGIPGGGGVPSPHLGMVARGSPHVGPGGAETTTLALQIGHLYLFFFFFSLKVSYQTAAYFIPMDGLVCLYRTTGQPSRSFTSPQAQSPAGMPPAPTRLLPVSSGIAAAGSGVRVPSPPMSPLLWEQRCAGNRQHDGCSESPFLLDTSPTRPSNTSPTPSLKQPRWMSISSGPSPKPARAEGTRGAAEASPRPVTRG